MNHTPSQTDHERMMEYHRIAIESKVIIEGIQKKLGVFTTTEALQKIAALEAVAEAAQKAEKELRRKLRDGETLHELIYRAQQILTTALAALDDVK